MMDDLVTLALADTDFIGDLDPATLDANAADSADLAAQISEDRTGIAVPPDAIEAARALLVERGYLILAEREQEAIDWLRDGQQAGDLDRNGNFIPWPRYP